jgi:hypothetical protein
MKNFWDKKNPNKSSQPLSPKATDKAREAGRPYPNLVDNSAAKRKFKLGVY